MEDELKTKEQLISELRKLRRFAESFEESAAEHRQINAELLNSRENYRSILEASPN